MQATQITGQTQITNEDNSLINPATEELMYCLAQMLNMIARQQIAINTLGQLRCSVDNTIASTLSSSTTNILTGGFSFAYQIPSIMNGVAQAQLAKITV